MSRSRSTAARAVRATRSASEPRQHGLHRGRRTEHVHLELGAQRGQRRPLEDAFHPGTRRTPRESVSGPLRDLLDGYASAPAFVLNPAKDFVALNAPAGALFSPFQTVDNLARMTFLDPAARRFFVRWDEFAASVVAGLRHASGLDPDYPRLRELVGALRAGSEDFGALWSSQAVYGKTQDAIHIDHPDAGPLSFVSQALDVRGATGQLLVIYQPERPQEPAMSAARRGAPVRSRTAWG
ncbi:MmyB family transcriptional regulator [Catenuloplanes japonicus]|uniref:MmyB family transcriptional regulator n=1 Tax=Catenuloplanes japonicus TaxID=33876 RepID=UPI0018DDDFB9|nr:hypothetical protein [Catenuloplanes japonicus]